MKQFLAAPVLFAMLLMPTGCATTPENIGLLAADLRDVGREGTIYALAEKPEWRPQVELVRDQLAKLGNQAGPITIESIVQTLSQLPFEELQSSEARLAFTGGRIILRRVGANVDLSSVQNLQPLALGLALGIEEGLALQKKLKL